MNVLEVNAARLRIFGVNREDAIGKKCYKAFWNNEGICADCPVPAIFEAGKELRKEQSLVASADGMLKHLDVVYVPLFDERGNVVQVICDMRDVTERKRAEEALAASKAHTESIIQNFLDTLIVVDTEAKIQTVNPATYHLLGYTEEEFIGQPVSIIFAEEEVHRFFQFFREPEKAEALRQQDTIRNRELTYKTKDGRLIPMSFNASVLTDEGGNVTHVVAGAKDITELKLAEAEIRKEKRFLENIIATVPDSLLVIDKDLRIKSANRSFYEKFQTEPEEVIGSSIADILQDGNGKLSTALTKLFGTEDMLANFALHYQSEKLGERIFNITARGILIAEEELLVIEDVTERKRAEDKINASLQEKEILLKEVHHRVKNNFQVISSLLNLQSERIKDKHAFELFKISQNRIKTMALIHAELYQSEDLARIDFAKYIRKLVAALYNSYGVDFETIKLNINAPDVLLGVDTAIPCGLIINELVSNCLKHAFPAGKEGELHIDLRPANNKLTLTISDSGVGFPKDLDFRNTKTLGMQLVISLTNQLDGTIELDKSGGGTTFYITFAKL